MSTPTTTNTVVVESETGADKTAENATAATATVQSATGGCAGPARAGWVAVPGRRVRVVGAARAAVAAVSAAVADLQVVTDRPESLRSGLALARHGAWTTTGDGPLRRAAVAHFWIVQAPVLVLGAVLAWAARTPGRVWTVVPVLLSVATGLDQVPVVDLLVPEFVTWPYWPPFCWFTEGT